MAFLLRQISFSAEGREIVRESRIDDDLLRIGRDPEADIKLTDLAVALQHAVIERVSPGQLGVSASPGLKLELNGSSTSFGRIDLPTGGEIRIASHLIRVMPTPPGARDIELVLERVSEPETGLDPGVEERFSLGAVLPGKRSMAWVLTILLLGLFLAWPIKSFRDQRQAQAVAATFHPDSTWTAGPLSRSHAFLQTNCTACHQKAFVSVRDDSCRACHKAVHDHADPFRMARARPDLNSWGRFQLAVKQTFNLPPGRCIDCHREHEGKSAMPATQQRFCTDCHADLPRKLPDTKLGKAGDFGTSHPDFKPAVITHWNGDQPVLQRIPLEQHPQDISNLKFPHDLHLSKTNGVAQMARRLGLRYDFGNALQCKDCHTATSDGVRFQKVTMEAKCMMCHSLAFDTQGGTLRTLRHGDPRQVIADLRDFYRARLPNAPATLGGMARRLPGDAFAARNLRQFQIGSSASGQADRMIRAVFSRGGACFDCHTVIAPPRGSMNYEIKPVAFETRYMNHGWFDHRPHQQVSCSRCHKAEASGSSTDLLLPGIGTCRECHGGENSHADVPSTCAMCHDYHFDAGTPQMLIRAKTRDNKLPQHETAAISPGAGGTAKAGR